MNIIWITHRFHHTRETQEMTRSIPDLTLRVQAGQWPFGASCSAFSKKKNIKQVYMLAFFFSQNESKKKISPQNLSQCLKWCNINEPLVWRNRTEYLEGNTKRHFNEQLEESNFAIKNKFLFQHVVQNGDPPRLQMKKAWRKKSTKPWSEHQSHQHLMQLGRKQHISASLDRKISVLLVFPA